MRDKFPLLKSNPDLAYLDTAASSQKPGVVLDGIREFYETSYANVHRGIHTLAEKATEAYEDARKKVASLINASPDEVIFTKGTTGGINLVANSIVPGLKQAQKIVVTIMEHHSNFVPWQQLCQRYGLALEIIPLTPDKSAIDMDIAKKAIDSSTALVAVSHVSNMLGAINDVRELARIAHENGSLILVDGAQAVAHMPVDVKDLDVDFYAFSGHKMYGPTGIGALYGKKEILESMEPPEWGGEMVEDVTVAETRFQSPPARFEAGTPNIAGAVGLGLAADFLQDTGYDVILMREKSVIAYAIERLQKIEGLVLFGPRTPESRGCSLTFTLAGHHPHDIAEFLDRNGIAVRAGHHCTQPLHCEMGLDASVRASIGLYNTRDDIDRLAEALEVFVESGGNVQIDPQEIASGQLTREQEVYKQNILEHYRNPRNKRALDEPSSHDLQKNPFCGDEIEAFLAIDDGMITDISFQGKGCAISQAAMSMLTKRIKGKSIEELRRLQDDEAREYVVRMLGIPIGPVRMKCAMLGLRTVQKAIAKVKP